MTWEERWRGAGGLSFLQPRGRARAQREQQRRARERGRGMPWPLSSVSNLCLVRLDGRCESARWAVQRAVRSSLLRPTRGAGSLADAVCQGPERRLAESL